jgi:tetratricopeptide (TPR) repeat protein
VVQAAKRVETSRLTLALPLSDESELQCRGQSDDNLDVNPRFPRQPGHRPVLATTTGLANSLAWIACLAVLAAGCGRDRADREYFAALRGEESGMTREEQIARLDRAIHLAPRRASYYETRAIYWIDLRQFDRARNDLDRTIELAPRSYAYFLRGLVSCQMGEFARSLEDFDTAIALQAANTQFYRGRSLARAAAGDALGALRDAEHLVSAVPQQAESYYARGVALTLLGRDGEAVDDFDRAQRIRSDLAYVVEARGRCLERLGEVDRARADIDAAVQLRAEHDGCAPCLDPFRY